MRVLVLSSVYPSQSRPTFGVFVRERVRHLAARCEVRVVAPVPWFPGNRWLRGRALAATPWVESQDGIRVYHPRVLCVPAVSKCLDGVLYFVSILPFCLWLRRRFAFDVIDAHFSYPDGVAGVLLGKVFARPAVVTLRGTHDVRHAGYALRRIQTRWALRAAARLVSVSAALRGFAGELGIEPERVRVVPNGVDPSVFRPADRRAARRRLGLSEDRTILLAVGSLTEGKGHHRLLELLPGLVAQRPELLLVIIGTGPARGYERALVERVRQHGLADHVRLVGPRPHEEVATWMAAADLFCLATRSEGWCNAIMEALACGLPVVTTRVGGNPELVRDGEDGFLVPFWSEPEFAAAVVQALETTWDREAIAARAGAMGWGRTAEQVMEELVLALAPGHAVPGHAVSH
jgi:teichuronic acid biosynthesis glycosyltransferase TuaC